MTAAGAALAVVGAEGLRSLRERLLERALSARARRQFPTMPLSRLPLRGGRLPVLNALPVPLDPRWGGVPGQLRVRLEAEKPRRAVALLSPVGRRYRLEVTDGPDRAAAWLGPVPASDRPSLGSPEVEAALSEALRATRAGILHLEGAAGWPLEGVAGVLGAGTNGTGGVRLVLSVHDFGLYCPRPHLLEEPGRTFCRYCEDDARCTACLREGWPVPDDLIRRWRRAAAALLDRAHAIVFASRFLLATHRELFPGTWADRALVVPPAVASWTPPPGLLDRRPVRRGTLPHVAFVGSYRPHKGALLFEAALGRLDPALRARVRWSAYGGGDPVLLRRARRLGVLVRGYYRFGTLPSLLRSEGVDLALLLSIWPEAYAITLSECRQAGVPAVVLDLGAPGERVAARGGGFLIDPETAEEGLVDLLGRLARGALKMPSSARVEDEPGPAGIADAWGRLYAGLGEPPPEGVA